MFKVLSHRVSFRKAISRREKAVVTAVSLLGLWSKIKRVSNATAYISIQLNLTFMNPFHCGHHEKVLLGASVCGTFLIASGGPLLCLAAIQLHIHCDLN